MQPALKRSKANDFWLSDAAKKVEPAWENVVGRDEEVRRVIQMLVPGKHGFFPLLIGLPQVGKKTIVKKFAAVILNEEILKPLQGRTVVEINCSKCVGTNLDGTLKDSINRIVASVMEKYGNPILFFKSIDRLLSLSKTASDYLQSLKVTMIASVTGSKTSSTVTETIKKLRGSKFSPFYVNECSLEEARRIAVKKLEHVKVSDKVLDLAMNLSNAHLKRQTFPMKVVQVMEQAALRAWFDHREEVESADIAEIVSQMSRIPMEQLLNKENIEEVRRGLEEQLIGQPYAIDVVMQALHRNKLGITNPNRPRFVGLLIGPTGVGKTEFVKLFAQLNHYNLIRFDMSEYMDKHSAARLTGSPPGYVGYRDDTLSKKLQRHPHSVILIDEVEKAHPRVLNVFLQLFDEGRITDGEGNTADGKNTYIFMTSNLGSKDMEGLRKDIEEIRQRINPYIKRHFAPELLNRMTEIIPFTPLSIEDYQKVIEIQLKRIKDRLLKNHQAKLTWSKAVCQYMIKRYPDEGYGARKMCQNIEKEVGNAIPSIEKGSKIRLRVSKGKLLGKCG